jgi:hypothetical protein
MANKAKRSQINKTERTFLANCSQKIVAAYNDLVSEGVNPVGLVRLIKNRTLPPHRPRKTDETARLQFSLELYQQEHPGATDKAAILAVLERSDAYKELPLEKQESERLRVEMVIRRRKRELVRVLVCQLQAIKAKRVSIEQS